MRVTASFYVPQKHEDAMRRAIEDGDFSWVRETLDYADLLEIRATGSAA